MEPCELWAGYINPVTGYGQRTHNGRTRKAATVAWEKEKGPVPKGLVLDHTCRNRACVKVAHLEPVTQRTNVHRGRAMELRKFVCDKCGTPYEVMSGKRRCRPCRNEKAREPNRIRMRQSRAAQCQS